MLIYAIILFVAAALFLYFGISLYKGNTKLIHDYHQTNVKESERLEYGKAFAKGMFAICVTLLISGLIALFALVASFIILAAGMVVSFVILGMVQKKFIGGTF